jgi:hypothetical protein
MTLTKFFIELALTVGSGVLVSLLIMLGIKVFRLVNKN